MHQKNILTFKRCLTAVLLASLCFVLIGCGNSAGSDQELTVTAPSTQPAPAETAPIQTEAPEVTTAPVQSVTLEESILYEQDGVKITVKGMEDSFVGKSLKFLVENGTDKNIAIACDNFIVNGITMDGYMYIDVAANKKANGTLDLYSENLEECGIAEIASVSSFGAYAFDTDSYDTLFNFDFEIKTSIADSHVQEIDESGEILYSDGGFTVIPKRITEDLFGSVVVLFIKNESDKDVIVQASNVSVNGFTITSSMSSAVAAGTVSYCDLTLFSEDLEANEIEAIEDVSFTLTFLDPDTFSTISESSELQVFSK